MSAFLYSRRQRHLLSALLLVPTGHRGERYPDPTNRTHKAGVKKRIEGSHPAGEKKCSF